MKKQILLIPLLFILMISFSFAFNTQVSFFEENLDVNDLYEVNLNSYFTQYDYFKINGITFNNETNEIHNIKDKYSIHLEPETSLGFPILFIQPNLLKLNETFFDVLKIESYHNNGTIINTGYFYIYYNYEIINEEQTQFYNYPDSAWNLNPFNELNGFFISGNKFFFNNYHLSLNTLNLNTGNLETTRTLSYNIVSPRRTYNFIINPSRNHISYGKTGVQNLLFQISNFNTLADSGSTTNFQSMNYLNDDTLILTSYDGGDIAKLQLKNITSGNIEYLYQNICDYGMCREINNVSTELRIHKINRDKTKIAFNRELFRMDNIGSIGYFNIVDNEFNNVSTIDVEMVSTINNRNWIITDNYLIIEMINGVLSSYDLNTGEFYKNITPEFNTSTYYLRTNFYEGDNLIYVWFSSTSDVTEDFNLNKLYVYDKNTLELVDIKGIYNNWIKGVSTFYDNGNENIAIFYRQFIDIRAVTYNLEYEEPFIPPPITFEDTDIFINYGDLDVNNETFLLNLSNFFENTTEENIKFNVSFLGDSFVFDKNTNDEFELEKYYVLVNSSYFPLIKIKIKELYLLDLFIEDFNIYNYELEQNYVCINQTTEPTTKDLSGNNYNSDCYFYVNSNFNHHENQVSNYCENSEYLGVTNWKLAEQEDINDLTNNYNTWTDIFGVTTNFHWTNIICETGFIRISASLTLDCVGGSIYYKPLCVSDGYLLTQGDTIEQINFTLFYNAEYLNLCLDNNALNYLYEDECIYKIENMSDVYLYHNLNNTLINQVSYKFLDLNNYFSGLTENNYVLRVKNYTSEFESGDFSFSSDYEIFYNDVLNYKSGEEDNSVSFTIRGEPIIQSNRAYSFKIPYDNLFNENLDLVLQLFILDVDNSTIIYAKEFTLKYQKDIEGLKNHLFYECSPYRNTVNSLFGFEFAFLQKEINLDDYFCNIDEFFIFGLQEDKIIKSSDSEFIEDIISIFKPYTRTKGVQEITQRKEILRGYISPNPLFNGIVLESRDLFLSQDLTSYEAELYSMFGFEIINGYEPTFYDFYFMFPTIINGIDKELSPPLYNISDFNRENDNNVYTIDIFDYYDNIFVDENSFRTIKDVKLFHKTNTDTIYNINFGYIEIPPYMNPDKSYKREYVDYYTQLGLSLNEMELELGSEIYSSYSSFNSTHFRKQFGDSKYKYYYKNDGLGINLIDFNYLTLDIYEYDDEYFNILLDTYLGVMYITDKGTFPLIVNDSNKEFFQIFNYGFELFVKDSFDSYIGSYNEFLDTGTFITYGEMTIIEEPTEDKFTSLFEKIFPKHDTLTTFEKFIRILITFLILIVLGVVLTSNNPQSKNYLLPIIGTLLVFTFIFFVFINYISTWLLILIILITIVVVVGFFRKILIGNNE